MKIKTRNIVKKIKIKELFTKLNVGDNPNDQKQSEIPIFIKTPYGFKRIVNFFRTEKQQSVTTYFGNNRTLKTSVEHRVKSGGEWRHVGSLKVGDLVECDTGHTKVTDQRFGKHEILYDISVDEVRCYYSNGILSHNSWVLTKLGQTALQQNKNVVHFSLELAQMYVGRRYDCCFTGVDFQNVINHREDILEALSGIESFLKIKYFPTKTATALTLKNYVERVQTLTGKKVDIVIVDYADILRPVTGGRAGDTYNEAGNIYEELRGVAGELQVPIWTASQGNRESSQTDIIEATGVADSYKKVMTADFVLSLSRKRDDKAKNTARFFVMKNRFGPDGITLPSQFNADCGNIRIFDSQSEEGVEIFKHMKSTEDVSKERLRNIWENDKKEKDLG